MPQLTSMPVPDARLRDQDQPTLEVHSLTLRPWRLSDAPAVAEAYADPEIRRWHARSMDELEAQEWIASWTSRWSAETGAGWAVTRDDVVVGRTSFGIDLDELAPRRRTGPSPPRAASGSQHALFASHRCGC